MGFLVKNTSYIPILHCVPGVKASNLDILKKHDTKKKTQEQVLGL